MIFCCWDSRSGEDVGEQRDFQSCLSLGKLFPESPSWKCCLLCMPEGTCLCFLKSYHLAFKEGSQSVVWPQQVEEQVHAGRKLAHSSLLMGALCIHPSAPQEDEGKRLQA